MQGAPCVLSVRPQSLVQYYDVSVLDFERKPCTRALKQNVNSVYGSTMRQMSKFDEIPNTYYSVTDFANKVKDQYDLHKKNSESLGLNLKEYGTLSSSQKRSFKKCLETMISNTLFNTSKTLPAKERPYLSFCTLTLPIKQHHTDKVFRKLLIRFIENLTKTYGVKHYVWKAEPQENGNIHFHIVLDRFVKYPVIRKLWNAQLNSKGLNYIDKYYKFKNTSKPPSSTEIKSLKNIQNVTSYIGKYMLKTEKGKRPIIGKIWGCSNLTKKLEYPKFYDSEHFFDHVLKLTKRADVKLVMQDDYFTVFNGKIHEIIRKDFKPLWSNISRQYKRLNKFLLDSLKVVDQESKPTKEPQKEYKQLEFFRVNVYKQVVPILNTS